MTLKDWWLKKPYWFKGGSIGVISILVYYIIFDLVLSRLFSNYAELLSAPFAIVIFLSAYYFEGLNYYLIGIIILFALYFLIGAFIGWIIKKVKSK